MKNVNNSQRVIKDHVSTISKDKTGRNIDLLRENASVEVTTRGITNHVYHEKSKDDVTKKRERVWKIFNTLASKGIPHDLIYQDDKLLLGMLKGLKTNNSGFSYTYDLGLPVINFVVFIWQSQREYIKKYGDIIFIDSTFNVSNLYFKAIVLTVIDQHYKSILAATLVRHEGIESYEKFLDFILAKINTKKRKILYLISDSAFQIHKMKWATIYCGFHLLREEKIFDGCKNLENVDKDPIRKLVYMSLISQSMCKVEDAVSKLCNRAFEPKYAQVKKRIMNLVGHALNGSCSSYMGTTFPNYLWEKENLDRILIEESNMISKSSRPEFLRLYTNYVREYVGIKDPNNIQKFLRKFNPILSPA